MKHVWAMTVAVLTLFVPLRGDELEKAFATPPASAKPWAYWFWVNGNISKQGITDDLEAMQRVGIGGVLLMECAGANMAPQGPLVFGSPEWRDVFNYALREAKRLGLEVNMNNDAGFTGSGGPWITPELSMQKLVWTEKSLSGPKHFEDVLPQPESVENYYRDIAVMAIPEQKRAETKITASSNLRDYPAAYAADGDPQTRWISNGSKPGQGPVPARPEWLQIEYPEPFAAAAVRVSPFRHCSPRDCELQCSQDGKSFQSITRFTVADGVEQTVSFAETKARFFRLLIRSGYPHRGSQESWNVQVCELALLGPGQQAPSAKRYGLKPALAFASDLAKAFDERRPTASDCQSSEMIDLTKRLDASGRLVWDVPNGQWTVLRFGHTSTGRKNHPAPEAGLGLECDKLRAEAVDAHFNAFLGKLLKDAGPEARAALTMTHIDSWETGSQTWTERMAEEFRQRAGYELRPWLPALTGRVVNSPEQTERFIWDWKRTIASMMAENYAGRLRTLANQHDMKLSIEAYSLNSWMLNSLTYGAQADVPMGEFWINRWNAYHLLSGRLMASVAHNSGRKIVAAESFTAGTDNDRWHQHPYTLKTTGDWAFAEGINRLVMCFCTHQPWRDRVPGMTLGQWGLHFDRTQTWWEPAAAWMKYMARCQYLLQEGSFAADLCLLVNDGAEYGNAQWTKRAMGDLLKAYPSIPAGYNYDYCSDEMFLQRAFTGSNYRVLVLPDSKTMTPEALKKLTALVRSGAVVVGPKPERSPSLRDYPACDAGLKKLADELWGDCDGKTITEHVYGKGRVVWGRPLEEVFRRLQTPPDFSFTLDTPPSEFDTTPPNDPPNPKRPKMPTSGLNWIHRRIGDADVYFVANPQYRNVEAQCTFRVHGKQPELFEPDTGRIRQAERFAETGAGIQMPIRFDPAGSVFVVFRKTASPAKISGGKNWDEFQPVHEITGPWEVAFDSKRGGPSTPVTFTKLDDWSKHSDSGVRYYSGTAKYREVFQAPPSVSGQQIYLDLGKVEVIAEVFLNGKSLGTLWKPPFRVNVTDALNDGDNTLEIKVTNTWANRLIGDEQYPDDCGFGDKTFLTAWPEWLLKNQPRPEPRRITFKTWRHYTKDSPLSESGLLGPVTICTGGTIKLE